MVLKNPESQVHMYVNIGYTLVNIASVLLFIIAFKWKANKLIFYAYALVAIRNAIRLLDLEDSIAFNQDITASTFTLVF